MKLVILLISLISQAEPNSILLPKLLPHKGEHSSIFILNIQEWYSGVLGKYSPLLLLLNGTLWWFIQAKEYFHS